MKYRSLTLMCLVAFLIFDGKVAAGEVAKDLRDSISGKALDATVRVWIKLPDVQDSKQLKASLVAQSASRAERHRAGLERLKANHAAAQQSLLNHLIGPGKANSVRTVKPHWLVNIIEAEVTVGELEQLAARSDVEIIYAVPKIVTIPPSNIAAAPASPGAAEWNLRVVNAHAAWAAGYTGKGRVVCSFDTGVEGTHPALYDRWKGHDGDSAAAWFDPKDHEPFPHTIPDCGLQQCNISHGTHTMGTMLGVDDATADTIGVAPDATWISAAVIDIAGTSIIDGFEWAADPDGDPNSLNDVPDVINHSWGVPYIDCQNIFYGMIEATEALGIVNIFSAGNHGGTGIAETILNPAVRALNDLDCFAVGNLDTMTWDAYSSTSGGSSRGPSSCPFGAYKPNVVTPGVAIRSSVSGGGYDAWTGTSMAAPHVSGLVALLREKNPNATVDEIKSAILNSTDDLGYALPNNNIGWGMIDCMAALNYLSGVNSTPNVVVYAFDHPPISPGATVLGKIALKNKGADVNSVTAKLATVHPSLTVIDSVAEFGNITEGDTSWANVSYRVIVSDTVTPGSILSLDLSIVGIGYSTTGKVHFLVEPRPERLLATHSVGNIDFTITNFGTYGIGDDALFPMGGVGFKYKLGDNDMWEGGLMIGINTTHVSDGVRNVVGEPDGDFGVLPGGNIEFVTPLATVSQQTHSRFSDERAQNPIGLEITQNSFAYDYDPYQDFIILQYIITNTNAAMLFDLYVGLFFEWDVQTYNSNAGGYDSDGQFNWIAYNGGTISDYRGVKVVDGNLATAYTQESVWLDWPNAGSADGYIEVEKYFNLADGFTTSDSFLTGNADLYQVTAAKLDLAAGAIDTVAFAIIAGDTYADIQNSASRATEAYLQASTDTGNDNGSNLPGTFVLHQNYPNPFNPKTTITFDMKRVSDYTLSIYNLVGRKVDEIKGHAGVGPVKIVWDAREFASGIYLYRLEAGDFTGSRRMVLLK